MLQEDMLLRAALCDRSAYTTLAHYGVEKELSDKARIVWKEVRRFYEVDTDTPHVDKGVLKSRVEREYPKHADTLTSWIEQLEPVSVPNVVGELVDLKKENVRTKLAVALTNGKDDEIEKLFEEYNSYRRGELNNDGNDTAVYYNADISDLVIRTNCAQRIKLLPAVLNDQLDGGLLPGHHVVVFAPTEMGKSLFGLNAAYGFVKQGKKVLYCGNEDPMDAMIIRFLTRLTGMTIHDIRADPDKCDSLAKEKGYENIIFAELAPGTPHEIRELVEEYKPDCLIVDQIRNLYLKEQNRVLQLEKAAQAMRNFGKEYQMVVISLTQAADSATGKVVLNRGDVDFSNIGIPGTADLMLGIGADEAMESQGLRMITPVKNKVGGEKLPVRVTFDHKLTKVA